MLHIFRISVDPKNVEISIINVLKNVRCVLVFTNLIEYNTTSAFVIEACRLNGIPFFVFGENTSGFIYNDNYFECKFKNALKDVDNPFNKDTELKIPDVILNKENTKCNTSVDSVIEKLRERYSSIKDSKEKNSIKFLYDKNEQKRLKQNKKSAKEVAYYNYEQRRKTWIKEIVPKI